MMIQSIDILQTYSLLSNTPINPESIKNNGTTSAQLIAAASAPLVGQTNRTEETVDSRQPATDSVSFSTAGMVAYANKTLQERAVEELNRLMQEMDANAQPIESLDPAEHTPDKTAEFIVSSSLSFYAAYMDGHPELAPQASLDGFMSLISGGIERGLAEARDLLKSLNVLNGVVEENVNTTATMIQERLNQFYEERQADLALAASQNQELDHAA